MAVKTQKFENNRSSRDSKFNPSKYGKLWSTIEFEHMWNRVPTGDSKQPIIGKLLIGGKMVELTFTECSKIIDTLEDAKYSYNVGVRMGAADNGWNI
tara:strand:+ start:749 stop:1039 length:291 start_codon:yes stop_codon:yes gene_type:complete